MSWVASEKAWGEAVPLKGSVSFKSVLQKGSRVQGSKLVRMGPDQFFVWK